MLHEQGRVSSSNDQNTDSTPDDRMPSADFLGFLVVRTGSVDPVTTRFGAAAVVSWCSQSHCCQ